jgi:hypothetical protein
MMPTDASSPRAAALRAQKLLADLREQGILPPANTKGADGGITPAQRAAAHQGVGDNLREAVTDVHTDGLPVASSWVDQMSADIVLGDGTIAPELAFAKVQPPPVGTTLSDPHQLAAQTADLIGSTAVAASLSHGSLGGQKPI